MEKKQHGLDLKKIISMSLAILLCFQIVGVGKVQTVKAATGTWSCGTNATATLAADGTLVISGTGMMSDYAAGNNLSATIGTASIKKLVIQDGITSIGNYSFYCCTALESVDIADSVTKIGNYVFQGCTSLTSIDIPDSVTKMGAYAFKDCTSIRDINISDSITSIDVFAFAGCTALTNVNIPCSLPSLANYIFQGCASLKKIDIPDTVTSIGNYAFDGCAALSDVRISNKIKILGNYVFRDCISLVNINIPDSLLKIGDYTFSGCQSLIDINIPNTVWSLGNYAFQECVSLISIILPDSVTEIGESAFAGCKLLTNIHISNAVKTLKANIFQDCISLISVDVPDSVTKIESGIFQGCTSLINVTIPNSVTLMGTIVFAGCSSLDSINLPSDIGCSYNGYDSGMFRDSYIQNFNFTDAATSIHPYYFASHKNLTFYVVPDTITSIGAYAFGSCTGIKSMDIPENVTQVDQYAFTGMTGLVNIYFYNPDTVIGTSAIPKTAIVHGLESSTAKAYANANGLVFELMEAAAPSVPEQEIIYDKHIPDDVKITVKLGIANLKASGIADVKIDNVDLETGLWNLSGSTLVIDKTVFAGMTISRPHFITIIFDDISETTTKNAKVKIIDTTPIQSPTVIVTDAAFNRLSPDDVVWMFDYGTEASEVKLYIDSTEVGNDNYSNSGTEITLNKFYVTGLSTGKHTVEFKFNDADATVITDTLTVIGEKEIFPNVSEQVQKYTGTDLKYVISYGNYATSISGISVNNATLPSGYYTVEGTALTISNDYLSVLSNGLYSISLIYNDGTVINSKLSFTVPKDIGNVTPQNSLLNIVYMVGSTNDLLIPLTARPSAVDNLYIDSTVPDSDSWSYDPALGRLTVSHGMLNTLSLGTHSMILATNDSPGDIGIIISTITNGTTGLTYIVDPSTGNIIITGYEGTETIVIIPGEIGGSTVTGIDDLSGSGTPAGNVTIPDTVTDINPGAIDTGTEITGGSGSAAEDYANGNGNEFTPSGSDPGGQPGTSSVKKQNITYDISTSKSPIITGVLAADGSTVDYVVINGYKIWADGTIESVGQAKNLIRMFTVSSVTPGAVSFPGTAFTYDPATGQIVLNKEMLNLLGLTVGDEFSVTVGFSDGTIVDDAVTMSVIDSSDNTGTGSDIDNENGPENNNGSGDTGSGNGNGNSSGSSGNKDNTGSGNESPNENPPVNIGIADNINGNITENEDGANGGKGDLKTTFKKTIYLINDSKIKIRPAGLSSFINYTVSNKRIVKVTSTGTVTGLKAGTCKLYARTKDNNILVFTIVVREQSEGSPYLHYSDFKGYLGGSSRLYSDFKNVKFTSSSKKLPVSSTGTVKFNTAGTYEVIMTESEDGVVVSHTIKYKVVKGFIILGKMPASIKVGSTATLKANVMDSADNELVWKSKNSKIAKISVNGRLTALKAGKVKITASCGNITASFTLKVK